MTTSALVAPGVPDALEGFEYPAPRFPRYLLQERTDDLEELMPLARGYDGPIVMLVGLDTKGILAGVIVTDHHEPYGSFSVEPPEFAAQFKGKDIRDAFKVGGDIDAVSRATISVTSATRAIKNSSRRIARQYLTAPTQ